MRRLSGDYEGEFERRNECVVMVGIFDMVVQ